MVQLRSIFLFFLDKHELDVDANKKYTNHALHLKFRVLLFYSRVRNVE